MKEVMKWVLAGLGLIVASILLIFLFGKSEVIYMQSIGKEKQNARREIFEETQGYVEGKRQEAVKLYKEYSSAETIEDKNAIKKMVSLSFANFDENKLQEPLRSFVYQCKYH